MSQVTEVKERLDIVDVVARYVDLRREGREHKGLCPLHSERTPSFTVSAEKQLWYCHGCDEGGDMIKFVEKVEQVPFARALALLAQIAGVDLQQPSPPALRGRPRMAARARNQPPPPNVARLLERVHAVYRERYGGSLAREYLVSRGLARDDDPADPADAGFAPGGFVLRDAGFDMDVLWNLGLIQKDGRDRFSNRVVLPYTWQGRISCLHGRDLGAEGLEPRPPARFEDVPAAGQAPTRSASYSKDPIVYARVGEVWLAAQRDPALIDARVDDEVIVLDGGLVSRRRQDLRDGDQVLISGAGVIRQLRHLYSSCQGRPESDLHNPRYHISEGDLRQYPWLASTGRYHRLEWVKGVYNEGPLGAASFMVVEAALDALAAQAVGHRNVVAAGGAGAKGLLLGAIRADQKVLVCTDHDAAGDRAWDDLRNKLGGRAVRVAIPAGKKDWAEYTEFRREVRAAKEAAKVTAAQRRRGRQKGHPALSVTCPSDAGRLEL